MAPEIEERLVRAYRAALAAAHDGARVEVHMGSDMLEHLRSLATVDASSAKTTVWGFPIVETPWSPDHLSIHTVQTIA